MIGLDLTVDASGVVTECLGRRLLINATHGHVIRLLPALNLGDDQIEDEPKLPSFQMASATAGTGRMVGVRD